VLASSLPRPSINQRRPIGQFEKQAEAKEPEIDRDHHGERILGGSSLCAPTTLNPPVGRLAESA
jgi:hypothetical protein